MITRIKMMMIMMVIILIIIIITIILNAQDNKCLQVTLLNNFQLFSDSMDEITHFLLSQVS